MVVNERDPAESGPVTEGGAGPAAQPTFNGEQTLSTENSERTLSGRT